MGFRSFDIKGGCCGFPVARSSYFKTLSVVEIASTLTRLPREATVRKWREEAPPDFEFSLLAWNRITHQAGSAIYRARASKVKGQDLRSAGHFRPSELVARSWEALESVAAALKARFIVFETPPSFYPNPDALRDMYRFFKRLKRSGPAFVWDPRGNWDARLKEKVCGDLGLLLAENPFAKESAGRSNRGRARYFRFLGRLSGRHLDRGFSCTEAELHELGLVCGDGPSYLFFGNHAMWKDAKRFQQQFPGRVGPAPHAGPHRPSVRSRRSLW